MLKFALRSFLPIFGIKPLASVPSLHTIACSNNPNGSMSTTSRLHLACFNASVTSLDDAPKTISLSSRDLVQFLYRVSCFSDSMASMWLFSLSVLQILIVKGKFSQKLNSSASLLMVTFLPSASWVCRRWIESVASMMLGEKMPMSTHNSFLPTSDTYPVIVESLSTFFKSVGHSPISSAR